MKRLLFGSLASVALLCLPGVAFGQITGSVHDFSTQGWAGGQICLPCHATHNNATTVTGAPLWNHELTTATFTTYDSPTFDAGGPAPQPGGTSKLCLSCHDGTVAVDAFGGNAGTTFITGPANLGTDISNDHPISFVYNTALFTTDGGLYDPSTQAAGVFGGTGTIDQDMLFAGEMQCASCHDVHNAPNLPGLLRKSNASSALCLTCHNK